MLLFLDYDGVLHPDEVYLKRGRPVLRGPGELFMWVPHLLSAIEGADVRLSCQRVGRVISDSGVPAMLCRKA